MTLPMTAAQPEQSQLKAAIIVRLLRSVDADLSLTRLSDDNQIALARAIGKMGPIDRDTVNATIEEFTMALDAIALPAPGGVSGALEALDGQLSPAVASQVAEEAAMGDPAHAWVRLARLSDEDLAQIMEVESIEIASLLLSKLPVSQAARVLVLIPGDRARRIACTTPQIDSMRSEAVARIAHALAADHCVPKPNNFDKDAVGRVGAILNSTDATRRDEVLTGLDADDPEFALQVRKAIFTMENIPQRIDPLDVPKIIKTLDTDQLAIALGGALNGKPEEAAAAEFILDNMSKRMSSQLRDEINGASAPKAKAVEDTQALLIGGIRDAIETGEITPIEDEE